MKPSKILLVEDDENLREALASTLSIAGFEWIAADSAEQAILMLKKNKVEMVVTDVQMAGMNGLQLLSTIKKLHAELPVLLITAFANIQDAVLAMKKGAADYIAKPFSSEVLVNMIHRYLPKQNVESEAVVNDAKSQALLALAAKVAKTNANVLILGASGSGKEVLAKYVHKKSSRHNQAFVAINCAAIPENMLEATLFGYEKGAFTGAIQACPGKFELAQKGTILLDEISEMALELQAKLLRVLQEREVERLGSKKSIKLDVRVIATSNRELKDCVEQGLFREDLYYRLNVFPLTWPALCEREKDILPLAQYFLKKHCSESNLACPQIEKASEQKLLSYSWPGNVRELDNVMQRALILCQGESIDPDSILLENMDWSHKETRIFSTADNDELQKSKLGGELKAQEFSIILNELEACNGRRKEVANRLGISDRTLRYKLAKMRKAGIDIPS